MILYELLGSEAHPVYQQLEVENGDRQYDFLRSAVTAALAVQRPFLSAHILKALNFQAITCLHTHAGEFRPCPVTVGEYHPPEPFRVQALMDDFVNYVNRAWDQLDPVALACLVLWRLNHIHPFINGNGRTARAACYFVLCVKSGGWLSGSPILPELIRRNRPAYVAALKHADESAKQGPLDLGQLHALVSELIRQQVNGGDPPAEPGPPAQEGP